MTVIQPSKVEPAGDRTSFQWQRVTRDTGELAQRFYTSMCRCDPHLAECDFEAIYRLIAGPSCRYYLGQGAGFELMLGYQWSAERGLYQLQMIGCVGEVDVSAAVDHLVDNFRELLASTNQTRIFMIEPAQKQNTMIDRMCSHSLWHPALRMTGGSAVPGGTFWEIELIEAAA